LGIDHTSSQIPAIELPSSAYLSTAAKEALMETNRSHFDPAVAYSTENIAALRDAANADIERAMIKAEKLFPAHVERTQIGGIPVSVVTPTGGITLANRERVLIELHAGAFILGAGYGVLESIPVAALSKTKVVSVAYRITPENKFPAATEDVAQVYRALLADYEPENIGFYGSSAGGLLVTEAVAWFQKYQLPRPGAIAVLGASADARFDGDSRYTYPASGYSPSPGADLVAFMWKHYFGDTDLSDPLVSPVWSQELLSGFPPTLIVTSTRAHDLSSAAFTHRALVKAGAVAELHVWDGLPHCFYFDLALPESREVFAVVVDFFRRHLGLDRAQQ
jgi:epsilon-lactone hydrolase